MSSASAVMAFSPPESSKTFCSRLPGGEATMSMPASPELSGSVRRISAMPPPKIVWKASEKFLFTEWKACSNLSFVTWSSSAMACCVSSMDCSKSSLWHRLPSHAQMIFHLGDACPRRFPLLFQFALSNFQPLLLVAQPFELQRMLSALFCKRRGFVADGSRLLLQGRVAARQCRPFF